MKKTWIIHQLERKSDNGFVFNVHWRYSFMDSDDSTKTYYADNYGVASYTQDPESENYIPYEDLTEEIVIDWVKASLDMETIEKNLSEKIEQQKNPPVLTGVPWESNISENLIDN
jgi:hypothetical protein